MAWGVKYQIGFYDLGGIAWRINIENESFAGVGHTNKVTEWINHVTYPFDTLTTDGADITLAEKTDSALPLGYIYTNDLALSAGDSIYIRINFTNHSGADMPTLKLWNPTTGFGSDLMLSAGWNHIFVDIALTENYRLHFISDEGDEADFEATVEVGVKPTILKGTGTPCIIDWDNSTDDVFDPIVTSKAIIRVINETGVFSLSDLYSDEDMQYRISIYEEDSLYWRGFLFTKDYQEPYDIVPHEIEIPAECGLEILKEIPYKDEESSGEKIYYNGRYFTSQIILDHILSRLNHTEFKEFINVYEITMDSDTGDSPLDQEKLDVDVFKDMYCSEVLEHILSKFNATIIQKDGIFCIFRKADTKNTTMYGRRFTSSMAKTSISYSTDQFINRTDTHVTTICQIPGGVKMIQPPARKVVLYQNYGNKESWLDNYQFKAETFSAGDFEYWSRTDGLEIFPIGEYLPGEKEGVAIPRDSTVNAIKSIYQTIGMHALTSSDVFVFEFDYLIYNYSGGTIANCGLYLMVKKDGENYWLRGGDSEFLEWSTSEFYVGTGSIEVEDGSTGWRTISKKVVGLPSNGSYTVYFVRLYSPSETEVIGAIKNVRFYCTSSEIRSKQVRKSLRQRIREKDPGKFIFGGWKSKYQTVTYVEVTENIVETEIIEENDNNGVELEYDRILGDVIKTSSPVKDSDVNIDNILEQFAGSIAVYSSGTLSPSTSWELRDWESAKADRPLLEIMTEEIALQYNKPRRLIQMNILETGNSVSSINILGNFQDDLNLASEDSSGSYNRRFVFNRGSFDIRNRRWEIDLAEIEYEDIPKQESTPTIDVPVATDATNITDGSFNANWNAVDTAIKYYLDVATDVDFTSFVPGFENLDVGNNTTYEVETSSMTPETSYYYRVRAYDIWGQTSVNSNTITATTLAVATYQLYTNPLFWLSPEYDKWGIIVENLGSEEFNNNFKFTLNGTADGTPVTYTIITGDYVIGVSGESDDSVFATGSWSPGAIVEFDWDLKYTLTVYYDEGTAEWVQLASRTYNS